MKKTIIVLLLSICMTFACQAGMYNRVLSPGDPAPSWKDLPGIDGKKHSLADLKSKEVVVVVFTCCSCPAAEDYEDRILAFAKKYTTAPTSKIALVAINSNTIPEDRLPRMKERAEKKGFTFPYLYDETQHIARAFGATYTPEFFVLNKERKVVYMGAMDDRDDPAKVKMKFLEEAVGAAAKGQRPATQETLGRGCRIRYHRAKE